MGIKGKQWQNQMAHKENSLSTAFTDDPQVTFKIFYLKLSCCILAACNSGNQLTHYLNSKNMRERFARAAHQRFI